MILNTNIILTAGQKMALAKETKEVAVIQGRIRRVKTKATELNVKRKHTQERNQEIKTIYLFPTT